MMGNVSVNSPEVNGLYSLLDVLADPKKFKASLDAYTQAKANADQAVKDVQAREAAVVAQEKALAKKASDMETDAAYWRSKEADLETLKGKLQADQDVVEQRKAYVSQKEKELKDREASVVDSENSAKGRESGLQARSEILDKLSIEIAAREKAVETKYDNIRKVVD